MIHIYLVPNLNNTECTDGDLRLRDGTNQFEGRVEVCLNGVFGTVCDDGWGITDGDVVCGLLFGREYLSKETYLRNNWGERSEPPPSVADEDFVYTYIYTYTYVDS